MNISSTVNNQPLFYKCPGLARSPSVVEGLVLCPCQDLLSHQPQGGDPDTAGIWEGQCLLLQMLHIKPWHSLSFGVPIGGSSLWHLSNDSASPNHPHK